MSTFVRKSEFARLRGVTRAALTAWSARGLLVQSDDGRVNVEASNARLDERPEIYRGGQCSMPSTEATRKAANARQGASPAPTAPKAIGEAYKATKPHSEKWSTAEAIRRKESAVAQLKELEVKRQAGVYMRTDDARREMGRIAGRMVTLFEASLTEFANAIAAQPPSSSSRDVLRILRTTWGEIRARQSKALRAETEALPALIEDEDEELKR
jgi:hypothetical protein